MGEAVVRTKQLPDGAVAVEVRGALEATTVSALRCVLIDAVHAWQPSRLIVDLAHVPFMDSMGVGALVAGSNAARAAGGELRIHNPSPFVHRLLHITGLTELFGLPTLVEPAEAASASDLGPPLRNTHEYT
jgi:anti-sigma B factor antagonist